VPKNNIAFLALLFLEGGCVDNSLTPIKDPPTDGTPQIQVEPNPVDFGVVPAGESAAQVVTLSSVGDVTLNVTAMQIGLGRETFSLLEPLPGAYEPGASAELTITYTSDGSETTGDLQILSNDSANPNFRVPLLAGAEIITDTGDTVDTAPPPLSAPVAVCSVDPSEVLAIHEAADWIGNASYDTDGGSILDYEWTLISSPPGATTGMPAGSANRRGFSPDVAGEYIGELVVTDNDGLTSDPCYATLNATAGDGLWVEAFWTNSGDDMDLHLLDDGGTLTTDSDCYFANCTWGGLNWGGGGTSDDPILDLDDIPGTGPENINIDSPARGTYTVYVHDYPGSVYNGRNDVTVNVYLASRLVWTDTRNINSEGCYEPFVEINVPGGATTSLSGACR
jgi:hypothetical protein